MSTRNRIIVALDGLSKDESLSLSSEISGMVWGFKGHELFIREGFGLIQELKQHGKVFADLKFHDIPATVGKEVAAVSKLGADLISVHAAGGKSMLEAAVETGGQKVAAITVLTSLSEKEAERMFGVPTKDAVREFAALAHTAGVQNIVCSPHEIGVVKSVHQGLVAVVPGIRQKTNDDDQKRTMTAKEATAAGADMLVIGRPITKAPHPREALETILSSLAPRA